MKTFQNRCAVVTGAASGIGLALATRFVAEGMKVVLADVEQGPLEAAARALGPNAHAVKCDVSKASEVRALADATERLFGAVHLLCNNAGVGGPSGPVWLASATDWDWTVGVNLEGVVHGLQAFVPRMIAHGDEAHIVNTASFAGLTSTPFIGVYTATKFAVVGLSEVLVKDLELVGSKVRVSVLCPGFVKTRISDSERNRPGSSPSQGAVAAKMAGAVRALVEAGLEPAQVAEQVLTAIRDDRFYVLTHPELKPAVAQRMKDILEERPPKIDPMIRAVITGG